MRLYLIEFIKEDGILKHGDRIRHLDVSEQMFKFVENQFLIGDMPVSFVGDRESLGGKLNILSTDYHCLKAFILGMDARSNIDRDFNGFVDIYAGAKDDA